MAAEALVGDRHSALGHLRPVEDEGPVTDNLATVDNRDLAGLEAGLLVAEELVGVVDALMDVGVSVDPPHEVSYACRVGSGHLAHSDLFGFFSGGIQGDHSPRK